VNRTEEIMQPPHDARCRVGIDIGGTFTDLVCRTDSGRVVTRKTLSTTDDYSVGIRAALTDALDELGLPASSVSEVIHGSTVATNAILEGTGARTALLTTRGFRDVLELQRIRIPELYNLFYEKPKPLVPRRRRFEVAERIGPGGVVWEELDEESLRLAVGDLVAAEVEAVAICFLHAYANPSHEQVAVQAVREAIPQAFVTCSSEVLNELREYERMSTTVINAYVGPPVRRYLQRLETQLSDAGVTAPLLVMQCSGGVMTAAAARQRPAYIVESGPAAGVKAAAALSADVGLSRVITLDMGGTTAKASTVEDGAVLLTGEYEVGAGINVSSQLVKGGGYALRIPVVDVSEIGAGGGSLVEVDAGGRLTVGPRSAGAVPGPVCYDQGGTQATVTDAHVVLGYVNPRALAGGEVRLRPGLAEEALREQVAEPLGLSVLDAAFGVHAVASAAMMRAVKAVTTYRGRDPRDFTLVAFGGNGPVVAAQMARDLDLAEIIVPPDAGLFSAYGLLRSNLELMLTKTYLRPALEDGGELNASFDALEGDAVGALVAEGYAAERVTTTRVADMRYQEQGYELGIRVPAGIVGTPELATMVERFGDEHLRMYGHRAENEPVDIVTVRVTSAIAVDHDWQAPEVAPEIAGAAPGTDLRDVYFGPEIGVRPTPIMRRSDVGAVPIAGPVIIEEFDTSTVVPPDANVALDVHGNLRIRMQA
jgi:N-methylhydantoinase A